MLNKIKLAMDNDNAAQLVKALDECKGSHAAKYLLEALLKKGNEHTLQSLLALIYNGQTPSGHIFCRQSNNRSETP